MEMKCAADYPEVDVNAPTWIRKMRTVFRRFDSRGRGAVGIDEFLDIATNVLSEFPKSENYFGDQLVQAMIHLWYGVICTDGPEHQRTGIVMHESDFVTAMGKCINGLFKTEFVQNIVSPLFDMADGDKDGFMQQNEMSQVIVAFGGNQKEAELLFRILDAGTKKGVTKGQFEGILAEYFFDVGIKGKTAKLFGALINYKRPEDYPEVECGPVWEGKMRTMFRRLDLHGSGKLRCHDFIQIGRALAQRNHLPKHKADNVMRAMLDIWVHYFSVDKDGAHFTELMEKDFIHNLRSMINGEFRHAIDQFGWTFFKAVEVEGTGFISMAEYRNLQEAWRVGRAEAEGMFKVLDTDKDGKISSDEYLSAWCEYFLGEDPASPYKTFFGPVISQHSRNSLAE
ncbi:sarcoplasmic calcium binding protein [Echinococcus multilocularis]|uniref:Sarcoplasmic calcium binding protein n=1 Tax=Echinococcus multilocularis TaxID=6211 RepID=A0A087W0L2_ECHMU|nr:sarcoplasmic calcium binding protein [Echinococcus multilocularis]